MTKFERLWNRFWKHATITEDQSCWLWTGSKDKDGYGRFTHKGKQRPAHRMIWSLQYSEIPSDIRVLHHCNNNSCVRLDHLYLSPPQISAGPGTASS